MIPEVISKPLSLQVEQACFSYGRKPLITDFELRVFPGQLVVILGPNGAGKSTALKLMSGELTPSFGHVLINGQDVAGMSSLSRAQSRAVLPQHSELRFALTGQQVVALGRSPFYRQSSAEEDRKIVEQALIWADAVNLADRNYLTLSGGEKQRVHLARALAQVSPLPADRPRYLMLDEPTSSLDLAHQQHTLSVAKALTDHGLGVIAILHDLNLAAQYADRILIMVNGKVAAQGVPCEVLTEEVIDECFDVKVTVSEHPDCNCPLIISRSNASELVII